MLAKGKLIYIHGGSGVGKSTLARELQKILGNDCIWIDQDTFYKLEKPTIQYDYQDESGKTINVKEKNWDTLDAISMNHFNGAIMSAISNYKIVIITGFALRPGSLVYTPDVNILLDYGMSPENTREKMIQARQSSKGYQGEKAYKDRKRVEKVVWPYYEETLKLLGKHETVKVFDEKGKRILVKNLVEELLGLIRK